MAIHSREFDLLCRAVTMIVHSHELDLLCRAMGLPIEISHLGFTLPVYGPSMLLVIVVTRRALVSEFSLYRALANRSTSYTQCSQNHLAHPGPKIEFSAQLLAP